MICQCRKHIFPILASFPLPYLLPSISVYLTLNLSSPPPPTPIFPYFPTAMGQDGLDGCIAEWSHRGNQITAGRPWYRRQPCQCKYILTNPVSLIPSNLVLLSHIIPHSSPRNDQPHETNPKCVIFVLVIVFSYPTMMITLFIVLPIC